MYARQCTFVYEKLKKFLGRGMTPPHWGGGFTGEGETSSPDPTPLIAYGASIFAPSALMLIFSPSKHENQTPYMLTPQASDYTSFPVLHIHFYGGNLRACPVPADGGSHAVHLAMEPCNRLYPQCIPLVVG